jgi:hypothetical protein
LRHEAPLGIIRHVSCARGVKVSGARALAGAAGVLVAAACLATAAPATAAFGPPGTLANPGFHGERVKTTFFFAGQWRGPGLPQFYESKPVSNHCLYTVYPADPRHLGWSEGAANRRFALEEMRRTGVNVVTMSDWGPPGTDRWAFWAPMQTSTQAHDELFGVADERDMLITPTIESSAETKGQRQTGCEGEVGEEGTSDAYIFADDFPGTRADPAPGLVSQVEDLLHRYVLHPHKGSWKNQWAQLYDSDGRPRYAVHIIQAGSNQLCPSTITCTPADDEEYADGFGWVADRIYADTGLRVGFLIDAMPEQARFFQRYVPLSEPGVTSTGAAEALREQPAVLGVQSFIPEVFMGPCRAHPGCDDPGGSPELEVLIDMKQEFSRSWIDTGIPVFLDVSSGYDGHIVFPDSPRYGNNARWRAAQAEMLDYGAAGLAFNSWNGYTEGMAAVPACRVPGGPPSLPVCPATGGGDAAYRWWSDLSLPGG